MWRVLIGRYGHWMIWVMIAAFAIGVLLLFTPSLSFNNPNANNTSPDQQTAITVNGTKISQDELTAAYDAEIAYLTTVYQSYGGQDFQKQLQGAQGAHYQLQLRYQAAQSLIDNLLVPQQSQKRRVTASRLDVQKAFQDDYDQFLRSNQLTETELRDIIQKATPARLQLINKALGLPQDTQNTFQAFQAKLRSQAEDRLLQAKLQSAVVGQINPTDQELLHYVNNHKDQYLKKVVAPVVPSDADLQAYFKTHQDKYAPQEVKLSNILIKLPSNASPSDVQSASKMIQSIRAQLDKGADFADLAKKYSQDPGATNGGDLGYLSRDKMDPKIADVAFSLPVGKVSDAIRTAQGLGLIKVTDRRQKGFADVKEQLQTDYINELENQEFDHWQSQAQKVSVFPKTVEIQVSHILISVAKDAKPDQVQTASNKIAAIQKQLQAGADFAKLAQQYSEDPGTKDKGGDLGWFGHGVMDPAFDQAAFALQKAGDISPIVRSSFGFHLIKLTGRRETDAIKNDVEQAYLKDETKKRYDDWFKGMKSQAKIEYVGVPLLSSYSLENQPESSADDQTKRQSLDQAIAAYQKIQPSSSASDPLLSYVGYYMSRLYGEELKIDQTQRDKLSKESGKEDQLKTLDAQIERDRELAVRSFLISAASADDAAFQEILKTAPQNAQIHYYYALYLLQQNQQANALAQLGQALGKDPTLIEAQLLMGDLQTQRFDYQQAIGYYATALNLAQKDVKRGNQIQLKLGETYLVWSQLPSASGPDQQNALKSAQDLFLKLQKAVSPKDDSQLYMKLLTDLGDLKMQQKDYPGAEDEYHQALQVGAEQTVEIKLGQAYIADNKLDQAQQIFQSLITRNSYATDAYVGLGDIDRARGQTADALRQYRDALKRSATDDGRKAIAQKIIALDPKDNDTRLTLADIDLKQHGYQEAQDQYQAALQQDSNSVRAYQGLGDTYAGLLEWNQAINNYKSAIQLNPSNSIKITLYENILNATQQRVGIGQKLDTDGQDALYQLANLHLKQGSKDKAKEKFTQLQKDYPAYRPNDVTQLGIQLGLLQTPSAKVGDGKPGQPVTDQGSQLLPNCKLNYNTAPPTSGCHSADTAPWGVATKPLAGEVQVHNLAQGGVFLQYNPTAPQATVDQLTKLAGRLRPQSKYCKLIVAPYPGLDHSIALTAWDRIDKFDQYDEARITNFIDAFINAGGPEKDTACS